jgi:RND family efflux transporter MFP subunit
MRPGGIVCSLSRLLLRFAMHRLAKAAPVAAILATLLGCSEDNRYVAPPPPSVTVATPTQQTVTRYIEATGNTAAVNSADLVARVPGFVQEIKYKDGAEVKKGTLLFTIEPDPYKLKLDQSKAAETGAEANLKQTQQTLDRQADLLPRQTTTQANYDQALAARDSAKATLDQAQVNTQLARVNYDYTQVTAPFDGIVTARQVSAGEYVGGTATPTVLATIVQFSPLYVNFTLSESEVLRIRAEVARLGLKPEDLRKQPVEVGLQNEEGYPHRGTLDYASPTVDRTTGTLTVRAVLENAKRELLPGYFVRVRIPGQQRTALVVPDVALGSDQGGVYLLVVNKDNVVEQRKVEVGPVVGTMRVIEKGVTAEDRVIVNGLLHAIPGQKVDPKDAPAAKPSAPDAAR